MNSQILLPGGSERLPHNELVRTLDLIRETNPSAYTNMKLTITRVASMILVQDTEEAYFKQDTNQFYIYELDREQFQGFCRYLNIPAHDGKHTLLIRKGSEFAAVYVADWNTGLIYARKYIRSVRIILDLLDTFTPYLREIGQPADVLRGGESDVIRPT